MDKKFKVIMSSAIMVLMLASCGGGNKTSGGNNGSSKPNGGETLRYEKANGIFNYSAASVSEKSKILGQLENYAMRHHLAGIPLYDDAGYELFSPRIKLASNDYIPNYGFGVGESSLDPAGKMYNDTVFDSSKSLYPSYFQSYATEDSGTFNYWNSTGADVAGKNGMITASYFGVTMNPNADGYHWRGELARVDNPIPLDKDGNEIPYTEGMTSRFWRVPVWTDKNASQANGRKFEYSVAPGSKWASKYTGRKIVLDDYLTPFKVMLDNGFVRASGLIDDASGFAGASDYLYQSGTTKSWDGEKKSYFDGVGVKKNEKEQSMDFAFITPQTRFYAKYNTASGLYSPMPEDFLVDIGNGNAAAGAKNFGMIGTSTDPKQNCDNLLSCGAYNVISWEQDKQTVYQKNPTYNNASEIKYEGYVETGFKDEDQAFQSFLNGMLDEVSVPSKEVKNYSTDKMAHKTDGSTVIKINVNACTKEQWEHYFGKNGTAYPHTNEKNYWEVKPIMSNPDFLDGLYFCMDRKILADKTGHNPAYGYLSEAYKIDPETDLSFRDTEEGKAVTADYENVKENGIPGYSTSMAQQLFTNAIKKLVADGDYDEDENIKLTFLWRKDEGLQNIGQTLKEFMETPFNAAAKKLGYSMTLTIENKVAGSSYTDAYSKMDQGEFDFAEGAITGNVLNPISFMSVICTNELSQGFTTNWGDDTSKVTANPCEYDNKSWSYDALYTAANGAAICANGEAVPPVYQGSAEHGYVDDKGTTVEVGFETPDIYDDDDNPLVDYEVSYVWFQYANGAANTGYYWPVGLGNTVKFKPANDGHLTFTINKGAVQNYANSCANAAKTDIDTFVFVVGFKCSFTGVEKTVMAQRNIPLEDIGCNNAIYNGK
ncbi:MAG: ABC transporter substrate-binding protein [Bacilli bacterium]|nr:ABC transporter substrate-binding protein [Bacilli bacterium]